MKTSKNMASIDMKNDDICTDKAEICAVVSSWPPGGNMPKKQYITKS